MDLGTRIIPANTGKMFWCPMTRTKTGDHPREYGENALAGGHREAARGSSPRIRGKWDVGEGFDFCWGDHPREYGEN